jgi:hypothetical protein
MATPAHSTKPEGHDEDCWLRRRRPVDDGLPVHARGRTVVETQPLADVRTRLV